MKIYFAGSTLVEERELLIIRLSINRLFSYYYHNNLGMAKRDWEIWSKNIFSNLDIRKIRQID